jgi:hypothetical protein
MHSFNHLYRLPMLYMGFVAYIHTQVSTRVVRGRTTRDGSTVGHVKSSRIGGNTSTCSYIQLETIIYILFNRNIIVYRNVVLLFLHSNGCHATRPQDMLFGEDTFSTMRQYYVLKVRCNSNSFSSCSFVSIYSYYLVVFLSVAFKWIRFN